MPTPSQAFTEAITVTKTGRFLPPPLGEEEPPNFISHVYNGGVEDASSSASINTGALCSELKKTFHQDAGGLITFSLPPEQRFMNKRSHSVALNHFKNKTVPLLWLQPGPFLPQNIFKRM